MLRMYDAGISSTVEHQWCISVGHCEASQSVTLKCGFFLHLCIVDLVPSCCLSRALLSFCLCSRA